MDLDIVQRLEGLQLQRRNAFSYTEVLITSVLLLIISLCFSVAYTDVSFLYAQVAVILISTLYFSLTRYKSPTGEIRIRRWHLIILFVFIISWPFQWILSQYSDFGSEDNLTFSVVVYGLVFVLLFSMTLWGVVCQRNILCSKRNRLSDFIVSLLVMTLILMILTMSNLVVVISSGLEDKFGLDISIYIIATLLLILMSQKLYENFRSSLPVHRDGTSTNGTLSPVSLDESDDDQRNNRAMEAMAIQVESLLIENKLYLNPSISLELLENETGIPKHQLSHFFNAHYGKGFYHMIGEYRIQYATTLLQNDHLISLDALSEVCGFNSKTTFYKYFKEINGCTPNQYVRTWKDKDSFEKVITD